VENTSVDICRHWVTRFWNWSNQTL